MSSNHFSYFRVKNFKRFKDLEVKDIGQFNLVLGDNNVGKTSLLEALLWEPSEEISNSFSSRKRSQFIDSLIRVFDFRKSGNILDNFNDYLRNKSLGDESSTVFEDGNDFFEEFLFGEKSTIWFTYKSSNEETKGSYHLVETISGNSPLPFPSSEYIVLSEIQKTVPFIPFSASYDDEITEFYISNIQGNKKIKSKFVNSLSLLFPEIEDLEPSIIGDHKTLLINRTISDFSIPISYFGEGTIKTAKILSYLIKFSGKKLMIDEIDTGIHYSRMKDYWKVILQSAKENDVQVFATTHNKECIQYFVEAVEELGQEYKDNARAINLIEHQKTKEVSSVTFPFSELEHGVFTGNELR